MKITFFEYQEADKAYFTEQLPDCNLVFCSEKISEATVDQASDAQSISLFIDSVIDEKLLEKMPHLKLITTRSTGFDHIDLVACKKRGITVCNVPHYGDNTVAEHTFALLLDLSRKIHTSIEQVKEDGFSVKGITGFDLKGKTLGIIGTGRIGSHVARIARGFEMNIVAYDVYQQADLIAHFGVHYVSLETLLQQSDIITLHAPYNETTHHLINQKNINLVKRGAYLINTARGALIETEALLYALQKGILAGIGLDVLEEENAIKEEGQLLSPGFADKHNVKILLQDHILMEQDNVIVTPHNAFNSQEALLRILETTVENIKGFIEGKPIHTVS